MLLALDKPTDFLPVLGGLLLTIVIRNWHYQLKINNSVKNNN